MTHNTTVVANYHNLIGYVPVRALQFDFDFGKIISIEMGKISSNHDQALFLNGKKYIIKTKFKRRLGKKY